MDDDDLDDEMEDWNRPVFSSFRPLKWFFYAGSALYALQAIIDFAAAAQSAWSPKMTLAFCEHLFWAIGCLGIARIARALSPPKSDLPVNPPDQADPTKEKG
jgi:hypothetical protein